MTALHGPRRSRSSHLPRMRSLGCSVGVPSRLPPPLPTLPHLLIWLVVPCVQPKSCRTDGTIADRAPTVAALSGEDGTWLAVWETVCCGSDFDLVAAVSTTDGVSWGSVGALFDNAGMVSDAMRCGDV